MVARMDGSILATIQEVKSLPRRHQAFQFFKPVEDDYREKFASGFTQVIIL